VRRSLAIIEFLLEGGAAERGNADVNKGERIREVRRGGVVADMCAKAMQMWGEVKVMTALGMSDWHTKSKLARQGQKRARTLPCSSPEAYYGCHSSKASTAMQHQLLFAVCGKAAHQLTMVTRR
jgi:hypothetical protein